MRWWGLLCLLLATGAGIAYWHFDRWPWQAPMVEYGYVLGTPGPHNDRERLPDLALHLGWNDRGTRIIARQEDGTVTGWDTRTGQALAIAQTEAVFAYCPAEDRLVVNIDDAAVLLSLSSGDFERLAGGRHDHAAFSADCSALAIAREDESHVRIWHPDGRTEDIATAQPVRNSLMLSADGHMLAAAGGTYTDTGGHRTTLELFDISAPEPSRTVHLANPDEILGMWTMAFSPDGAGLMLGSQVYGQSGLRHIATASGDVRWGHDGFQSYWVRALAVSPDGIVLATGDEKGFLRLWDADTGTKLAEYRTGLVIQSLAFSGDGRRLAIGLWDGTIGVAEVAALLQL